MECPSEVDKMLRPRPANVSRWCDARISRTPGARKHGTAMRRTRLGRRSGSRRLSASATSPYATFGSLRQSTNPSERTRQTRGSRDRPSTPLRGAANERRTASTVEVKMMVSSILAPPDTERISDLRWSHVRRDNFLENARLRRPR